MTNTPVTDAAFERCIKFVLKREGGFVDHKRDPGGRTNRGITQKTLEKYLGRRVTLDEMVNLTEELAKDIYRQNYWPVAKGLPAGLDLVMLDIAVLSGTGKALRWIREARTYLDSIQGSGNWSDQDLLEQLTHRRQKFYESLPHFPTFGKGWTRRVKACHKAAMEMLADTEADKK